MGMDDPTETDQVPRTQTAQPSADLWALVVVWDDAGDRTGDHFFVDGVEELGRGKGSWWRMRPGLRQPRPPMDLPRLSRQQLELASHEAHLHLRNVGRRSCLVNGSVVSEETLHPGDVVEIEGVLVLWVTRVPAELPACRTLSRRDWQPYGEPDLHGLVGESAAVWALRDRIAFVGRRAPHVLVQGPSGTGKELVACALHRASSRGRGAWVSRSAATIPTSIADAELFGNLENYPNAGMPGRPGLFGEAHEGTLFLDEIGEVPEEVHGRLLRVLDAGEMTRLGSARTETVDVRLIAATNRPAESLKHDLLARFGLTLTTPPLDTRVGDIPLLAQHLVRGMLRADPELAVGFQAHGHWPARFSPALVTELLRADHPLHVRGLGRLLWTSIEHADGELPASGRVHREQPPAALTEERVSRALQEHEGNKTHAALALGVSRYQLLRLLKKWS